MTIHRYPNIFYIQREEKNVFRDLPLTEKRATELITQYLSIL